MPMARLRNGGGRWANRTMQDPIPLSCYAALVRAYPTESDLSQCTLCLNLLSIHLTNNAVLSTQMILLVMRGATQHPPNRLASLLETTEKSFQRCTETLDLIPRQRTVPRAMELRALRISPESGLQMYQAAVRERSTMHRLHQTLVPWSGLGLNLFPGPFHLGEMRIQAGRCTTILEEWASPCSIRNRTLGWAWRRAEERDVLRHYHRLSRVRRANPYPLAKTLVSRASLGACFLGLVAG